nr:DNA-binding domain-containing protein [Thiomonas sp.]
MSAPLGPRPRHVRAADLRRETRRQRALLQAIFAQHAPAEPPQELAVRQRGRTWHAGLAAYRANGLAHAASALRVQFPTVLAMLGEASFDAVCVRYWRSWPPTEGDLARIGGAFPACLAKQQDLRAWPWLEDCGRLDLALWQVMDEAPAALTAADLQRLAQGDPARQRVLLAPGTRCVASHWPIVTLWRLHQAPETDAAVLRAAIGQPGENAWVWREALRPQCASLDAIAAQWLHALRERPNLEAALDAAHEDFDFSAWLRAAVQHGWIDTVREQKVAQSTPASSTRP